MKTNMSRSPVLVIGRAMAVSEVEMKLSMRQSSCSTKYTCTNHVAANMPNATIMCHFFVEAYT
jgi:hypothetical protein